jgi:AraC-like DNA-binding protein
MSDLASSAGVNGFADVLRQAGHDPYRFAAEAGVPARALTDLDMRVRSSAMRTMIERAALVTGIDDLGIRMAECRKLSNWGALGLAVRDQPTLRKALEVMQKYLWLQTEAYTLELEETGEFAILNLRSTTWFGVRQAPELAMGVFHVNFRNLMGDSWRPLEIRFQHSRPRSIETHLRIFGRAPLFDQDALAIVMNRSDLALAPTSADPAMARQALKFLEQFAARRTGSFRDRVGREIVVALPRGACAIEPIAHKLGIDRRTLHRRLAAAGTSFTDLVDSIRADKAAGMLTETQDPVQKIAEELGFSGMSAFAHWFRRRFGESASEFRGHAAGEFRFTAPQALIPAE